MSLRDTTKMLGDPAQWEANRDDIPTLLWTCDIGGGAIHLIAEQTMGSGWRARVRGALRTIESDHHPDAAAARAEAHRLAIRMVQDIKDQMEWFLGRMIEESVDAGASPHAPYDTCPFCVGEGTGHVDMSVVHTWQGPMYVGQEKTKVTVYTCANGHVWRKDGWHETPTAPLPRA